MRTIYGNSTAKVLVNSDLTASFALQRGVRQGCPLSPYLYILADDALSITLDDPLRHIQGISLPGLSTLTNLSFVDDSTLYLQGAETNLDRAKDTLQDFCLASGSFVN
jgi:hypothetical protein